MGKSESFALGTELDISADLIRRFDNLGPRYTSYPTADRFYNEFGQATYVQYLQDRQSNQTKPPLSLYIHIPFCASICYYCACNKVITKDHGRSKKYLTYLEKELTLIRQHLPERETLSQLHLGGGSPTFLSDDELCQLMSMLRHHFDFSLDAEISIEIDPRTVNRETLHILRELGFNRISLGVQDFDADVQKAIHRIQSFSLIQSTVSDSREVGFQSINFDLIYGLPKQTMASFSQTLDSVITLAPERIALYNYAHLPTRFKPQRRIAEEDLPSAETRLQIFLMSLTRLLAAGYVYIGLDHFAKPTDSLAKACADKTLHRNFQGYTTRSECDLIALGVSAIGKIGHAYTQNLRNLDEYYAALDAHQLPVEKGMEMNRDDVLRQEVIMNVMCGNPIDFARFEAEHAVTFHDYFAEELRTIKQGSFDYIGEGLIEPIENSLQVTAKGRFFVRALGMVFDAYLPKKTSALYSRLI
ncbi:MAG: oxygen-independent coproporphyrinogen III oxidase [Burkholderiaceae bacterium]|nr:oxygen-independent coproporphyrinogen III oxidase [Burkholderiaceae bacterium]